MGQRQGSIGNILRKVGIRITSTSCFVNTRTWNFCPAKSRERKFIALRTGEKENSLLSLSYLFMYCFIRRTRKQTCTDATTQSPTYLIVTHQTRPSSSSGSAPSVNSLPPARPGKSSKDLVRQRLYHFCRRSRSLRLWSGVPRSPTTYRASRTSSPTAWRPHCHNEGSETIPSWTLNSLGLLHFNILLTSYFSF